MSHVVVNEPGKVAVAVPVHDGLCIGRQDGNHIVLADVMVSRQHARLERGVHGFEIVDLDAKHGTLVNEQRVEGRRPLTSGDRIQIGNVLLVFAAEDVGTAIIQKASPDGAGGRPSDDPQGRRLRLVYEISGAIGGGQDIDTVLGAVLSAILDAVDCERGVIGLAEKQARGLRRIARTRGGGTGAEVVVSRVLVDAVLTKHESLLVFADSGNAPGSLVRESVRTAICAPLVAAGRLFGFVYIDDRQRELGRADLDYLTALAHLLAALVESAERRERAEAAAEHLRASLEPSAILGESPAMQRFMAEIAKLAPAGDAHVLIRGESGTGKELAARTLHARSPRRDGPWLALNCAAMPDTMVEAELFGHERGAFTGAARAKRGKFALADGGSLFLDEIADLSAAAQAKVLRAIEEGEIQPLGSERTHKVDVRVISATHEDLAGEVAAGRFRQDLYYRLAVVELHIPPLRERGDDIALLAHAFLADAATRMGKRLVGISSLAIDALRRHPWPGNVRELRNEIERAAIVAEGQMVGAADLSQRVAAPPSAVTGETRSQTLAERYAALEPLERELVEAALGEAKGNVSEAARMLGISRIMMKRRAARWGMK